MSPADQRCQRRTGGTFTYDGQSHEAAASATGVNGEPLGPLTITYNGSTEVPVNAGAYDVVATFAGDDNYNAASATATIVILRATPTIGVVGGIFLFDGTTRLATASASGVNGESLPVTITYVGSTPLPTNDETYRVIATFAGDANYLPAAAETTLTIVPPKGALKARYWKTHLAAWPAATLDIGGISYSQAELVTILGADTQGDARLGLMKAVIVAKLNAALGLASAPLQALIDQADGLFASLGQKVVPGSDQLDPASDLGLQMIALRSQFVQQHKLNLKI